MNAMKQALIRAHRECPEFPVERPKPREAFWCLEKRLPSVPATGHKRCGRCHAVKPFDAFHVQSNTSTGRNSYCKACRSEMHLQRKAAA